MLTEVFLLEMASYKQIDSRNNPEIGPVRNSFAFVCPRSLHLVSQVLSNLGHHLDRLNNWFQYLYFHYMVKKWKKSMINNGFYNEKNVIL